MAVASRSALLSALHEVIDASRTDGGRVVLLVGEAGIGKTTLLGGLLAEREERVLRGTCEPLATARPLLPLHDWSRHLDVSPAWTDDARRHEFFEAWLDVVTAEPTVAVVDDLQWADDATADLLTFLARRLADSPTTLVLAGRRPSGRIGEVVAHLGRMPITTSYDVPPLAIEEIAPLTAGTDYSPSDVLALTGGNAFYATELLRSGTGATVSSSLSSVVLERLHLMTDAAVAVVEMVSVVPGRTELSLLLAHHDAAAVDAAVASDFLQVSDETVAFGHELARGAVADTLGPGRARALHRQVLAALVAQPTQDTAAIAFHADAAGDHDRAVTFGVRAAAAATRAGAHGDAASQLERVLTHRRHVPPARSAETLIQGADALARVGRGEDALALQIEAVDLLTDLGNHDLLAETLANQHRSLLTAARHEEAEAVLVQAERTASRAPGGMGELHAKVRRAYLEMLSGHDAAARERGREAIAAADRLDCPELGAVAHNVVGSSSWTSDPAEAERLLRAGLQLAMSIGDDTHAATIMVNLGSGAASIRSHSLARHWLERCLRWCEERDIPSTDHYAMAWLARVDLQAGDWRSATTRAQRCRDSSFAAASAVAGGVLATLAVRRGDADAGALVTDSWSRAVLTGQLQHTWPAMATWLEHAHATGAAVPEEAVAVFAEAVACDQPWAAGELAWRLRRAGALSPEDSRLVAIDVAGPWAAMLAGDWSSAGRQWNQIGCPLEAALARAASEDLDAVRAAVSSLDDLGAAPEAEAAAEKFVRLGGRGLARVTTSPLAALTAREHETLDLLRGGRSNRQIARALGISEKTASVHVSNVIRKLGVSSRTEAALLVDGGDRG
ncbi:LuxR family transcriptional regulator [Nocardioides sp.]|uniref:helix-turn-helix transcriptional regulator n=1 Tax=Nocardioides sp. TaxID=35761 RepID=UPI0026049042|nr:LuxR family transcriptional regulator [Nocardioides sp.]